MEFSFSSSASKIIHSTGFSDLAGGDLIMIGVGCTLIYLAIGKKFEPLLLLPMGFGCLLANLPLSMMASTDSGGLLNFFYQDRFHYLDLELPASQENQLWIGEVHQHHLTLR